MSEKPYIEERNFNVIKRTFSNSVDEHELTWHRDREDRIVIPINENDWLIQFDNELPRKLNVDEEFFIPKNSFHRVIKGKTDLVVEIIETTFEENEYEGYEILEEGKKKKKDACYYKVRSRYDVWPSAYASGALVKCRKVGAKNWGNSTDESIEEGKKTDFSKEKEEGLHGWFARQGGKGKSKGWVDCNTCRKDPETGRKKCKSCGRKKGEKRDYPACRPTPSACGTRGKGKKWGKKSLEESFINVNVNSDLFKNRIPFLKQFKDFSEDNKVFFQKVDFNKDVDMFFGGDIINFKQVNTSIEFSYIIDKIHDNYFHMFNLKFELIIQPSDDLDDLTSKILMITFNKNINEKLSHFEEISSKNEKLNDEELNKIINIINGKFFEIENFITNKLKLNIKNPLNENIWNFK